MKFSKRLAQSLVWRGVYFITLFFVNLLMSRYLQAAKSGLVFYISNTFAFVQLVAGLSFENGITFFASGKLMSANKLLWFCLLWTGIIILLQLIVFHFFSFGGDGFESDEIPQYAFCFITGLLLTTYSSNIFYAKGNFFVPNLILSVFNSLYILFLLVDNTMLQPDKELMIDIYFYMLLAGGVTLALSCIVANKSWQELDLPKSFEIKKFLRYSLSVLLFNVLLFLVYRIDYYFVKYSPVCTASDLGNYIQASKLGQVLLVIPQIIGSAIYPQVSSGNDVQAVRRIIFLLMKVLAVLYLLLIVFVWLIGGWLFPFLFGETFQYVQMPLLFLLPGMYGLSVISFVSNFFSGQGNVLISVRAASVALLIVVTGDFLLVYKYGIVSAAIVSSVGYLVMFSLYFFLFKKESDLRFADFFRWKKTDLLLIRSLLTRKNKT